MSTLAKPLNINIDKCPRCLTSHQFVIDELSENNRSIYLPCPRVNRYYRVTSFWLDLEPNIDMQTSGAETPDYVRVTHGEMNLEKKVSRWRTIRQANIWLIDDYNDFLEHVLQAYTHGLFFPAMTSACCLAERIMNRLIIKLRDYFKNSPHYKRGYARNEKIQNWDDLIGILEDWGVFKDGQVRITKKLHKLRTDSVHYVPGYDFESNSTEAITLLVTLLDSLFSVLHRTDVFRIFEIPGEIWVRADHESDPFVKEFVLPHSTRIGATFQLGDDGYSEDGARIGEMTEDEFISLRKEYLENPSTFHDGRTPKVVEQPVDGTSRKFIIP